MLSFPALRRIINILLHVANTSLLPRVDLAKMVFSSSSFFFYTSRPFLETASQEAAKKEKKREFECRLMPANCSWLEAIEVSAPKKESKLKYFSGKTAPADIAWFSMVIFPFVQGAPLQFTFLRAFEKDMWEMVGWRLVSCKHARMCKGFSKEAIDSSRFLLINISSFFSPNVRELLLSSTQILDSPISFKNRNLLVFPEKFGNPEEKSRFFLFPFLGKLGQASGRGKRERKSVVSPNEFLPPTFFPLDSRMLLFLFLFPFLLVLFNLKPSPNRPRKQKEGGKREI